MTAKTVRNVALAMSAVMLYSCGVGAVPMLVIAFLAHRASITEYRYELDTARQYAELKQLIKRGNRSKQRGRRRP